MRWTQRSSSSLSYKSVTSHEFFGISEARNHSWVLFIDVKDPLKGLYRQHRQSQAKENSNRTYESMSLSV